MLRYKYDPLWKYIDIYDDDHKITTVNNVETYDVAQMIALSVYEEYIKIMNEYNEHVKHE